jgi:hypothetical protein
MRYAAVSHQIGVPGSDAVPLRNSLMRRGNSIRNRDKRYRVLLWRGWRLGHHTRVRRAIAARFTYQTCHPNSKS